MKAFISVFIGSLFVGLFAAGAARAAQPIIVLVPGFFSSIAPGSSAGPYFSTTILDTLSARAQVYVPSNLSPVGNVATNGEILATYLSQLAARNPGQPLTLITHSAGGFYALRALTQHPELPVQTVVTIAAPYTGSEFIDNLSSDFPQTTTLEKYMNLQSLQEFRAANAAQMLATYKVPSGIRWIAVGGTQTSCILTTCTEARYLSWVLTITQSLMNHVSDGIVTLSSALGTGVTLHRANGQAFQMERWSDMNFALEHWEMVEDASLFHLVGVIDTGDIAALQVKDYNAILDRLQF